MSSTNKKLRAKLEIAVGALEANAEEISWTKMEISWTKIRSRCIKALDDIKAIDEPRLPPIPKGWELVPEGAYTPGFKHPYEYFMEACVGWDKWCACGLCEKNDGDHRVIRPIHPPVPRGHEVIHMETEKGMTALPGLRGLPWLACPWEDVRWFDGVAWPSSRYVWIKRDEGPIPPHSPRVVIGRRRPTLKVGEYDAEVADDGKTVKVGCQDVGFDEVEAVYNAMKKVRGE